ncbi:serine hydrolase domain-containing protein [Ulvibacter antarcticus]|uniref:CubicO group peptidase (Beta-lactamase class C family) n=1 Tax=Ulvibacter antarcticus TaxID=442714 RepID=A0A3L9Z7E4_9FLAO|nr:serine hydrolase [Ulvibacter antarcticus]RMA66195.1 CubicO group peptidase (beta-lactamase class C family) [Ulvibacter antarcticus]
MKLFRLIFALLIGSQSLLAQLDFSEANKKTTELLSQMNQKISNGDYEQITSVLISQNGKVLFEKYYNDANKDSKHNTRSSTKTVATFLTGIAIDKGFIASEKDKIFDYLKHKLPVQNPDPRKLQITIEDLLTMSCMLETDDSSYFSRGHEERMYFIEDWTQFLLDLPIRSYPFNPPPSEQPFGRFFHYSSAQAAAVAEIVQTAVGIPLDEFYKKHFLTPLEITDYKLDYTPSKILNTAGGSEYKSRDFLKMIQLCLQKGKWNGQQIISETWIEKATTPKVSARENVDYGYFIWLNSFGKDKKYDAYYMAGNGGNKMIAIPELNVSVVITTTNFNNRNAHSFSDEMMNDFIVPAIENMM